MEEKVCSVCSEVKSLYQFYSQKKKSKSKGEFIYYNPECKECTKSRLKQWRIENPEKNKVLYDRWNNTPIQKERMRVASKKQREEGYLKQYQQNNKEKVSNYNEKKRQHGTHDISNEEWENCKNYFNYRCAYCDLRIEDHYNIFAGKLKWTDFHQEHVDDGGANDLSNCIPACKSCNSKKWEFDFEEWYIERNPVYEEIRKTKILKWLNEDYKLYINKE